MSDLASSMMGCAAAMCVEHGTERHLRGGEYPETLVVRQDCRRGRAVLQPKPKDAVRSGTCLRCGLRGTHGTPGECITALRDRLADLE